MPVTYFHCYRCLLPQEQMELSPDADVKSVSGIVTCSIKCILTIHTEELRYVHRYKNMPFLKSKLFCS